MNKLTTNEFAVFMADVIKGISHYQYDAFYDISKIVQEHGKHRGESKEKVIKEYHLMTRNTGCDLVEPSSEYYETYKRNNQRIYKLVFCWNCDYFHNEPFATVEELIK